MRTDLALALVTSALRITDRPAAWVTRMGTQKPHDVDMHWVPVLHRAFDVLGLEPHCLAVLTKTGWSAPMAEDAMSWHRLRIRDVALI
jgi:hypothetical protein